MVINKKDNKIYNIFFKTLLLIVMAVMFITVSGTSAYAKTVLSKSQTKKYIDKIADYEINKVTTPEYGSIGGEWLIMGLARGEKLTNEYKNKYINNVVQVVKEKNGVLSDRKYTEYARLTIAMTAIGENPRDIAGYDILRPLSQLDNVMATGLNGPIFALIAFDSGNYDIPNPSEDYSGEITTRDKLISILVNAQNDDGGWAYMGGKSDVDMTAMVIQALAKYEKRENVKEVIRKGINYLSEKQNNTGAFSTAKVENCESTAQVLTAMSALNIKVTDERFVKKGHTVLDGLLMFYENGGFKHTSDTYVNQMATEQAMYSLVAYYRNLEDENGIYNMKDVKKVYKTAKKTNKKKSTTGNTKSGTKNKTTEKVENRGQTTNAVDNKNINTKKNKKFEKGKQNKKNQKDNGETVAKNNSESIISTSENITEDNKNKETDEKNNSKGIIAIVVIILLAMAGGIVAFVKKKNIKKILSLLLCITILFGGCGKEEPKNVAGKCTISVECSTINDNLNQLDKSLRGHIPKDGIILKEIKVSFNKNDTVYDVLKRELKNQNLLMEASFTGKSAYVEGIDNIYEFSCGQQSGWMYSVNDKFPQVSCSDYKVKDGDVIKWKYTCDLGEDVK